MAMAGHEPDERTFDPGTRVILGELRDLRVEMRADRRQAEEERQRADAAWREERRQAEEERQRADAAWQEERRRAEEARQRADAAWQEERRWAEEARQRADAAWQEERRQAEERFRQIMQVMQGTFADIRTVGTSIVKTLNHHTRLLERIDRKLGAWGNGGRPGQGNGGRSRK